MDFDDGTYDNIGSVRAENEESRNIKDLLMPPYAYQDIHMIIIIIYTHIKTGSYS